MKIKYYGTGTSGAIPEMFCSCRVCEYARSHGGKDIRSRSQATVGDLMIDFSHDAFMHTVYGGLDMRVNVYPHFTAKRAAMQEKAIPSVWKEQLSFFLGAF